MEIIGLASLPTWTAPLLLITSILITVLFLWLELRARNERCPHCGASNPIATSTCGTCGESTAVRRFHPTALLVILGVLLAGASVIVALIPAQSYRIPPTGNLLVGVAGLAVMILCLPLAALPRQRRNQLKRSSILSAQGFYGGFCGNCGGELLGGSTACARCGSKVSIDPPNWRSSAQAAGTAHGG